MDMKWEKYIYALSVGGAVFGSLLWAVLSGFIIGKPLIALSATAAAAVLTVAGTMIMLRRPELRIASAGILLAALSAANMIFLELVYDYLPEQALGYTTGKSAAGLLQLRMMLWMFFSAGAALSVFGFLRTRRFKR